MFVRLLRILRRSPREPVYHAFTRRYDAVVPADELHVVLGAPTPRLRTALDDAWRTVEVGLLDWRTELHLRSAELSRSLRARLPKLERDRTVVSLLIDQSGSMKGQKLLYAAPSADIAQEFLGTLGISCEVLGFTTSRWHGGRSRKLWNWLLRPRQSRSAQRSAADHLQGSVRRQGQHWQPAVPGDAETGPPKGEHRRGSCRMGSFPAAIASSQAQTTNRTVRWRARRRLDADGKWCNLSYRPFAEGGRGHKVCRDIEIGGFGIGYASTVFTRPMHMSMHPKTSAKRFWCS